MGNGRMMAWARMALLCLALGGWPPPAMAQTAVMEGPPAGRAASARGPEVPARRLADLPPMASLVGADGPQATAPLLSQRPLLLLVGSHHTIPLAARLPEAWLARGWRLDPRRLVTIAAVNPMPWVIKRLFVHGALLQQKNKRDQALGPRIPGIAASPVVLDTDGAWERALGLAGIGVNGFRAYLVTREGDVEERLRETLADGFDPEQALPAAAERILDAVAGEMQAAR